MSSLAKFLSVCNYTVCGSDGQKSEMLDSLAFFGIKTRLGIEAENEDLRSSDVVVYTDAIPAEHAELREARRLKKILLSRGELLGVLYKEFDQVIAVAGSHGKTTCTSMCAHVLKQTNVPFTAHIGGEDSCFGNFYYSGMEYLITELCEYKKNLLKIQPDVAILLNIDKDHMECYQNEETLTGAFFDYCSSADRAFVCVDDKKCKQFDKFTTFGIEDPLSDYRAVDLRENGQKYSFVLEEYHNPLCRVRLNAIGRCNVYNALATFAAMRSFGFHEKEICKGLETFTSVKRRFEKIGGYKGGVFICDYAHHPREILSTVATAQGVCRGNLYVVFQPHTYSRTKLLMREFVEALRSIKNLVIYKTYAAREKYDEEGCAKTLSQKVGGCLYAENVFVLRLWLKKTVKDGDVVLFLGAGDIYYTAQYLLNELK